MPDAPILGLFGHPPACPPVTLDRPLRPLGKEIFEYIQIYSRYFNRKLREYVQYVWFVPDMMDRTTCPPAHYARPIASGHLV
jgi:hypothetical protein